MQTHQHQLGQTIFPKDWYAEYMDLLGLSPEDKPNHSQMKKIFVSAIRDYKKHQLTLQELSGLATRLWDQMSGMDRAATDLGDVLFEGINLTCPFCTNQNKPDLTDLYVYYDKHRSLTID